MKNIFLLLLITGSSLQGAAAAAKLRSTPTPTASLLVLGDREKLLAQWACTQFQIMVILKKLKNSPPQKHAFTSHDSPPPLPDDEKHSASMALQKLEEEKRARNLQEQIKLNGTIPHACFGGSPHNSPIKMFIAATIAGRVTPNSCSRTLFPSEHGSAHS